MYQLTWQGSPDSANLTIDEPKSKDPFEDLVVSVMPLLWEEHCAECTVPECYSSCLLYQEREDKKCARFVYGIYPNSSIGGLFTYGAEIHFRRWGKLQSKLPSSAGMTSRSEHASLSTYWNGLKSKARSLSRGIGPFDTKRKLVGATRLLHHKSISSLKPFGKGPDYFFLEAFLFGKESEAVILEASEGAHPRYRHLFKLAPGWNRHRIPFENFDISFKEETSFELSVDEDRPARIAFTWLDFVGLTESITGPATKVKCIAWDLDNTLWEGIVGDDGDGVELNNKAVELVRALDKRGVIQVVVSKNEESIALQMLEKFELSEFFVSHRINWKPKSQNLDDLASELNLGINAFALIDDSEFERREVTERASQVRVYAASEIENISNYPELNIEASEEGETRRKLYQEERGRQTKRDTFSGSYEDFLRACEQRLEVGEVGRDESLRCLELLRRSNQFNLSGNRYEDDEFETLLDDTSKDKLFLRLADKHGSYGIVGFISLKRDDRELRIFDFVFSCRAAEKKIEEAFFKWLRHEYFEEGKGSIIAALNASKRNAPLRRVLRDIGFEGTEIESGLAEIAWFDNAEISRKSDDKLEIVSVTKVRT